MPTINRPVFIIGCPRSGTGLLHNLMRLHPDFAWITPLTNWICGKSWFRSVPPHLAHVADEVLHHLPPFVRPRFLRGPYDGSVQAAGVLPTHEGHSIWNRFCPRRPHHACRSDAVSPPARSVLRDVVRWHLRYHRRPRFVTKTPRNALRMPFFQAIFPDVQFIHLVRDGRAVAASILKMRRKMYGTVHHWWGARPPGWQDVQADPPIIQAAWMWSSFLETIDQDAARLPHDSVYTLRYEQLTRRPRETMRALFQAVGVAPERFLHSEYDAVVSKIRPPHEGWREQLTDTQKSLLSTIRPKLRAYGYLE